ncbi:MAG: NifB/NifX family molybdenum-iron cluster-binding protein [Promethearchaeati archaeon SRVP18_Atabeyarchaeia-1]
MKIRVSAASDNLEAQVNPGFGGCPYFVIVDTESMKFEAILNQAFDAIGDAGIQAAQITAGKGARVLTAGNVSPNAFQALSATGIKVVMFAF